MRQVIFHTHTLVGSGHTPHWLMKKAILEYLEREEAYECEKQEDLLRWQRYQDTSEHLSQDEARARLTQLADQARVKTAG